MQTKKFLSALLLSWLFDRHLQINSCQTKTKGPIVMTGPVFINANYLGNLMLACAAARRATGTRNGEQET